MKISILTLFPNMLFHFFKESIIERAQEKKLVEIELINIRDFAQDKYKTVDDRPYGGGAGMVLKVDVVYKALQNTKTNSKVILTSPKGKKFNQQLAKNYSKLNHLVILAGHYEGVDERILEFVDEEVSLGDFVLTGGEIVAAAIADATVRLIPGVLVKNEAIEKESFFSVAISHLLKIVGPNPVIISLQKKGVKFVQLLEYPHYTRPVDFLGKKVPPILLSGNHSEIENWRLKQAYLITLKKRPDLLK